MLNARAIKSADYASAANYLRLIQWNFQHSGKMPRSWADVKNQHITMPKLGDYPYSSNFGFLPPGLEVDYRGGKATVVAMAIDGEGVGRIEQADRMESGRLLVLHRLPDAFEVVRIAEWSLEGLFRNAGHDLRDYTGNQGKWTNHGELEGDTSEGLEQALQQPNHDSEGTVDRGQPALRTGHTLELTEESPRRDRQLFPAEKSETRLATWFLFIVPMSILIPWLLWSKCRKHRNTTYHQ